MRNMTPTAKRKVPDAEAVERAFAAAEPGPLLSEEDRDALREAAEDPRWIRMDHGAAFERLVCGDDDA